MKSIKVSDSDHKQLKQIALNKDCSIIKVISGLVDDYNSTSGFDIGDTSTSNNGLFYAYVGDGKMNKEIDIISKESCNKIDHASWLKEYKGDCLKAHKITHNVSPNALTPEFIAELIEKLEDTREFTSCPEVNDRMITTLKELK